MICSVTAKVIERRTDQVLAEATKKTMVKMADFSFDPDICLYPPQDAASQLCLVTLVSC
jgi:hypothetical protein